MSLYDKICGRHAFHLNVRLGRRKFQPLRRADYKLRTAEERKACDMDATGLKPV